MNDQQTRKVNEAAERFAGSLTEAYRALADRSVSAQELNAQLTQGFFKRVIENLGTQAEGNRVLAENLTAQQHRQREASQALARESVNAYMDFLGSVFAFPRGGTRAGGPTGGDNVPDLTVDPGEDSVLDDAVHHPLSSWTQTADTASPGEERSR